MQLVVEVIEAIDCSGADIASVSFPELPVEALFKSKKRDSTS